MLDGDIDKVYERFMAFEDCDFLLDAPWLRATIFRYLFTRLADKQRVCKPVWIACLPTRAD